MVVNAKNEIKYLKLFLDECADKMAWKSASTGEYIKIPNMEDYYLFNVIGVVNTMPAEATEKIKKALLKEAAYRSQDVTGYDDNYLIQRASV